MSDNVEIDDRRGYLYRHVRLDKGEVFYVGIGFDEKMKRPYSRHARNRYWKNIVNVTDYEVDILFRDLPKDELVEKEKEFISLYGRRDLGEGTLANMTDGGDGTIRGSWKKPNSWDNIKANKENYNIMCHNKRKPFKIKFTPPNGDSYTVEYTHIADFMERTKLGCGYIHRFRTSPKLIVPKKKSIYKYDFEEGTILEIEWLEQEKIVYPKKIKYGMDKFKKPFVLKVTDKNGEPLEDIFCEDTTDFHIKTKMTRKAIRKLKNRGYYKISKRGHLTKHSFENGTSFKLEYL